MSALFRKRRICFDSQSVERGGTTLLCGEIVMDETQEDQELDNDVERGVWLDLYFATTRQ